VAPKKRARKRADRTQTSAKHDRGKHTDGKKGGSHSWVTSQLRDKSFRMITDFLTMIMASGLLGMCFMCCTDPSTAAARYGLPPSKTAIALAITKRDGALSTVALAIGCVLEYRGKKGKEDNGLRLLSVILLAIVAVRWGLVLLGPVTKSWMAMLDGSTQLSNVEQIQLFVDMTILVVGISAVWCLQTAHEQRSVVTAPDFELAKMELQRLASEEEVLSRKQRSRIARIEYEAKKALKSKQKSDWGWQLTAVPTQQLQKAEVEHDSDWWWQLTAVPNQQDSGYSNSGDEAQGVAAKLASIGEEDAEHNLCSDCCVCLEEGAASRAIMPCRHLCLCADCENIGLELCPICREEITDIVQVAVGDEDDYF